MVWNAPHIHLMVNHLPVFAPALAIPLLILAFWKREEWGAFIGGVLLILLGAFGGVISVVSGERAGETLAGEPGVSMMAMSEHEEAAEAAAVALYIGGALAIAAGVIRGRKKEPASRLWLGILLASALISSAMVGCAALDGGLIRHPEIRPESALQDIPHSEADDDD